MRTAPERRFRASSEIFLRLMPAAGSHWNSPETEGPDDEDRGQHEQDPEKDPTGDFHGGFAFRPLQLWARPSTRRRWLRLQRLRVRPMDLRGRTVRATISAAPATASWSKRKENAFSRSAPIASSVSAGSDQKCFLNGPTAFLRAL